METSLQLGAWLLTYGIHSTLVIGGVWVWMRLARPRQPEVRELFWKMALVGGIVTTLAQALLPGPPWGGVLALAQSEHRLAAEGPLPLSAAQDSGMLAGRDGRDPQEISTEEPGWRLGLAAELKPFMVRGAFVLWLWPLLVLFGALRIGHSWLGLLRLRRDATRVQSGEIADCARSILARFGCRRTVEIWITPAIRGPMAAGVLRWRLFLPQGFLNRLGPSEREAVIAHELAHLVRGDGRWLMVGQWISCLFFFQPLNHVARRHLRAEAEYLADRRALEVLPDGMGLARSLIALGEWLIGLGRRPVFHPLATGMGACRSTLGKRVESLLEGAHPRSRSSASRCWAAALVLITLLLTALAAPRAVASAASPQTQPNPTMKSTLTSKAAALLAGTALFAATPAPAESDKPAAKPAVEAGELPDSLHGFSGHLSGKLVSKDVDDGSLVMQVKQVLNVWKGNKATQPKAAEGRTLGVGKIHGKALDVLVTLEVGDHFEIETKHVTGDGMVYLGEGIKKVAAPTEEAASAGGRDSLNGFRGMFVGELVAKDQEKGTLEVKIARISKLWKGNTATNTQAAIGQTWKINGVTGKWLDTLLTLKVGDQVEVEAFHHRGDELDFVGEWLKKVDDGNASANAGGIYEDMNGFKGVLVGKLRSKDVEKGVIEIEVESVKTVFKKNAAPRPESAVGQAFAVRGIAGKWVDLLLVLKTGDRIEMAAFHNGGEVLDFPGELLRKAE